jgi:hypothetical protein
VSTLDFPYRRFLQASQNILPGSTPYIIVPHSLQGLSTLRCLPQESFSFGAGFGGGANFLIFGFAFCNRRARSLAFFQMYLLAAGNAVYPVRRRPRRERLSARGAITYHGRIWDFPEDVLFLIVVVGLFLSELAAGIAVPSLTAGAFWQHRAAIFAAANNITHGLHLPC